MAKYKTLSVEDLLKAGVHFGHQMRRWNPKMAPYIFSNRSGIHLIDLDVTHGNLKNTCDFLYEAAKTGGQIIFVGTKRQASEIIKLEAVRCGALYVNDRWLGGTITNFEVIKKNMDKLVDLMRKREEGELDKYTKKERLLIDRDIDKLQKSVGGVVTMKGKPAALFAIDARRERTAIREANRAGIPVAALVDTNSDPDGIDYVIPGNDDAIRSIAVIMKVVGDAVEAGYTEYAKVTEKAQKEAEKAKEVAVLEEEKAKKKKAKKVEAPIEVSGSKSLVATEEAGKKEVKSSGKKAAK